MARLDLDTGSALSAVGERSGHHSHHQAMDQDLRQIQCRGLTSRAGDHDQGSQGAGQGGSIQPLALHLPRRNDQSDPGLSLHPVLLLETLPEQHHCFTTSVSDGPTGSTHSVQHDGRPHLSLKTAAQDLKKPDDDIFV